MKGIVLSVKIIMPSLVENWQKCLVFPVIYLLVSPIQSHIWPHHKYHIHCDIGTTSSVLGQMTMIENTKGNKLVPTNLLAIIPSKSGFYPSIPIQVENHPINYLTLSVLTKDGNVPRFGGAPFRINLRVAY